MWVRTIVLASIFVALYFGSAAFITMSRMYVLEIHEIHMLQAKVGLLESKVDELNEVLLKKPKFIPKKTYAAREDLHSSGT